MRWIRTERFATCNQCRYMVLCNDAIHLGDRCPCCERDKCGMIGINEAPEVLAKEFSPKIIAIVKAVFGPPEPTYMCGEYYCTEHKHPAWAFEHGA